MSVLVSGIHCKIYKSISFVCEVKTSCGTSCREYMFLFHILKIHLSKELFFIIKGKVVTQSCPWSVNCI